MGRGRGTHTGKENSRHERSVHSSPASGPSWAWTGGGSHSPSGAPGPGTWHPGASFPVGETGTTDRKGHAVGQLGQAGDREEPGRCWPPPVSSQGRWGQDMLWEEGDPQLLGGQRGSLARLPE